MCYPIQGTLYNYFVVNVSTLHTPLEATTGIIHFNRHGLFCLSQIPCSLHDFGNKDSVFLQIAIVNCV